MGLRVPTLLASPYVGAGIVHSSPLQHTSVLTTVRKLFGISGSLTRRDAAAPAFDDLFLQTPRTDTPTVLIAPAARVQLPFDATQAAPDDFMAEMARDWRKVTGNLPGAVPTPLPTSQDEIHRFLKSQVNAFLDYRARTARRTARGGARPGTRRSARRGVPRKGR
jgi:hypothetical protein